MGSERVPFEGVSLQLPRSSGLSADVVRVRASLAQAVSGTLKTGVGFGGIYRVE